MPYGVIVRVRAPIEAYDAVHAEITRATGPGQIPGCILHIGRTTQDGFEIIEVWQTKEQADTFNRDVGLPAMRRAGMPDDGPPPEVVEFDPRTVVTYGPFTTDAA